MSIENKPIDIAIARVRGVYGSWRRSTPVEHMRSDWDSLFWSDVIPAQSETVSANGVDACWINAVGGDAQGVVIYCHGGGFKMGSVRSHRDLMARISQTANCRVLGLNYRLAPEHQFPAPIEDAVAAYEWLLAQNIAPQQIAIAGDSAGGGLAASTVFALRERQLPLPAAIVMLSAWTDLTASGDSYDTRAGADPIHQRPLILNTASHYLGEHDAHDPLASPLFGDLKGLPPLLLQVGDRETGLDDSLRFAAKARAAGVEVDIEVFEGMIHVFQQFADILPEAQTAIDSIGKFLQSNFRKPTRT